LRAAVWWIRRDLRLEDNQALAAAIRHGGHVLPLFILDPHLLETLQASSKRTGFLLAGLHALDVKLRRCASRLILRRGDPAQVLVEFASELRPHYESITLFFEEGYSPYARRRDAHIAAQTGIDVQPVTGLTLLHPREIVKSVGTPYTVYTPFRRAWLREAESIRLQCLSAPHHIPTPGGIPSESLPEPIFQPAAFPAGEDEARRRLDSFTIGVQAPVFAYAEYRNRVDRNCTSFLSPYLRFGMLSVRQAVLAARLAAEAAPSVAADKGVQVWLDELIWREFYQMLLYHFPQVLEDSLRLAYRNLAWPNREEDFEAWYTGRSGFPIVDAAMRQLQAEGWMPNRTRMIAASFLVKDLLVDWRRGEAWFMENLIDGDPAANNGGWQWCAGSSNDAAPYFRIFNPIIQSRKFDPQGEYIRRWVPELGGVPGEYVHEPWKMPLEMQRKSSCIIDRTYPAPIVEHDWARQRFLAFYRSALSARG